MSCKAIKDKVLEIIGQMDFSESVEERRDCPLCKKEQSVIRNIIKEPQQEAKGRWYVERCENEDCTYWDCGFT